METESELMRNAPIVDKMQQGQKAPAARWRNIDDVTEFASKDIVACRRIAGKNETPRRTQGCLEITTNGGKKRTVSHGR